MAFWKQLQSRGYIFFRNSSQVFGRWVKKILPLIVQAQWLRLAFGAVILFAAIFYLVFNLVNYFVQRQALAFLIDNPDELVEQNAGDSPEKPDLAVTSLIYGAMPGLLPSRNPDPLAEEETTLETEILLCQENFLANSLSPVMFLPQAPRDKVVEYEVEPGDTISTIAAELGLTINTVLWANNLQEESLIQPGQKLIILPVSGIKHQVKAQETITSIAKKYQAQEEKIIAFNGLPADGQIQEGQELIVLDGILPTPARPRLQTRDLARYQPPARTVFADGKASHHYPFGYCTWYVAQQRYIPWAGHAKSWLAEARTHGFATGKTPALGAIMVTQETARYGHVAYVESVSADGKWVTISEMNAPYFGRKTVRTLPTTYPYIKGYIY